MSTRTRFLLFVVLLACVVPGCRLTIANAQDSGGENQVFLPILVAPAPPVRFWIEYKPDNVYSQDKHFFADDKGLADWMFTSSTYYGYFTKSTWIKNMDTGQVFEYVAHFSVENNLEQTMISMYREDNPGAIVLVQRLKASVKIAVFKPAVSLDAPGRKH